MFTKSALKEIREAIKQSKEIKQTDENLKLEFLQSFNIIVIVILNNTSKLDKNIKLVKNIKLTKTNKQKIRGSPPLIFLSIQW